MKDYLIYWTRMILFSLNGDRAFKICFFVLGAITLIGCGAYCYQLSEGLIVSNLTNQVSWGCYIANFSFLVGVAAAAVLLVIPTYVFNNKAVGEVVLIGELMAVSAIIMCLLFIVVDMGRPDRFLHIIPFIGRLNFPQSILAWDVVVLNGYLLLNLHIPGYLLFKKYKGEQAAKKYYRPFVYISIFWAVSIHTVTAFLYSGLGSRPFWNSAILAPRFLVSAFASGPALMILAFAWLKHFAGLKIEDSVTDLLRKIVIYALPLSLFLLFCEVFKEFYTGTTHVESARYLFFGLHGHMKLAPYMWGTLISYAFSLTVLLNKKHYSQKPLLYAACTLVVIGIWIEKGMGLVIPGFIPTPLGDLVEYTPSLVEFLVSLGIWAFGALLFILMARTAIAIQDGRLRA